MKNGGLKSQVEGGGGYTAGEYLLSVGGQRDGG